MAGYIGSKAVNLSTTGADINGDANIDGTLTSDGLTVDGNVTLNGGASATTVSADANRPGAGFQITGLLGKWNGTNAANIGIYTGSDTSNKDDGIVKIQTSEFLGTLRDRLKIDTNGDISFYEDTGTTPKFFWDASAESLGIGTSSPSQQLHLSGSTPIIRLTDTDTNAYGEISSSSSDGNLMFFADQGNTQANTTMRFYVDATERMRITSTGSVGIGTSSPSTTLHLASSGTALRLQDTDTNAYAEISTSDQGALILEADKGNSQASSTMLFKVDNTERMRIDSSGNLLVGKTSSDINTVGVAIFGEGLLRSSRSNGSPLQLNRLSTDGTLIDLRKDNSTVGSIAAVGGDLAIGTGDIGLRFVDSSDSIQPINMSNLNRRDNAIDLGNGTYRFDDIFATNGTINTSDRNEKQDIAELTDAEQRVAVAAKGLLRKFRWRDAVEAKGDEARTYFGIIAQDLQAAFAAEGLDAGDYAMFISSTWTDEETGEERTRMGVRYSELLAFIIGAL